MGGKGQARLLSSSVLIVGAGGLGAPLALYLAAAGIGRIGIADDDRVDLSNLQRQVIYDTADIGAAKVERAVARARAINPGIAVAAHRLRLDASNAADLVAPYDLVADGSDNQTTRHAVARACLEARRPLVTAAVAQWDGQLATFKPYLDGDHPCYACAFPKPPPAGAPESCAVAGVLGPVAGWVGTLQAVEVVKELLGIGTLDGAMLLVDALAPSMTRMRLSRRADCALCGGRTRREEGG